MPFTRKQFSFFIYFQIVLTVTLFGVVSVTLLVGQTVSPVSEAQNLMNKGQLDKALELLTPLSTIDPEPKGAEYLRGLILY